MTNSHRDGLGLICKLPGQDLTERRKEIAALFATALDCREIEGGTELSFASSEDAARTLLDFILFERVCCPTLAYCLDFQPDHSTIRLRITGASNLYG